MVDKYEKNSENQLECDLSSKTMRQVHGIVAFEIEITSIQTTKNIIKNVTINYKISFLN
jgi:transcriptional regulator